MTGLAWFPLYPGDYARDTQQLSLLEHGAYLLIMNHYYSTGSLNVIDRSSGDDLPINNSRIYRLCSAISDDEKKAVDVVLNLFFKFENGKYTNKKIESVIKEQTEKHESKSAQARAAVAARELKRREKEALSSDSSDDISPDDRAMIGRSSNQNQNQNQKKDKDSLNNLSLNKTLKSPLTPQNVNNSVDKSGKGDFKNLEGEKKLIKSVDGLMIEIGDKGLEKAKKAAPGFDIYELARIYVEGIPDRGTPDDWTGAFIGYVKKCAEKKGA